MVLCCHGKSNYIAGHEICYIWKKEISPFVVSDVWGDEDKCPNCMKKIKRGTYEEVLKSSSSLEARGAVLGSWSSTVLLLAKGSWIEDVDEVVVVVVRKGLAVVVGVTTTIGSDVATFLLEGVADDATNACQTGPRTFGDDASEPLISLLSKV